MEPRKKIIFGVIPARMNSTRFPGKPLADIHGKAMIRHVYERAMQYESFEKVYVATPDQEIREYCLKNGMNVVLTKDSHERASDRVAEAMLKIEKHFTRQMDVMVMIQGDEPMIHREMIQLAVKPFLEDKSLLITNLVAPIRSREEARDPNTIKVVTDRSGFALYFSREPIPSEKKFNGQITLLKQVCVIAFQRDFLLRFNELEPTPLEKIESIDMLRCLEHGFKVKMVFADFNTYSVDTPEDLERVKKMMQPFRA